MALTAPVSGGGKDFEPVSAGTHFGVCTGVFHVGLQPGSRAYPAPKERLFLRFEIPAERVEWDKDGEHFNKPAIIYDNMTFNMGKKSIMRAMVESWYSMSLTDEQAAMVDIEKFAGRVATLTIVHNSDGSKTYANIASVGPLPKGMHAPIPENPILIYHPDRTEQFTQLPKFLQEKITNQLQPETEDDVDEARASERGGGGHVTMDDFVDDDIPFITCGSTW